MPFRFSRDKWLVLAAMICGLAMVFLDSTVLPVALPTMQRELGISDVNLQWIVNVYFLGNAGFVIFGGKLADIYGSRKVYISGLLVFGIASVLGGIAMNTTWLLTSRTMQGFGAALLAPATTAIIVARFPHDQRGKAIGISVAIGSLFLSLGPFIGGFVTEFISWRWIFFINIFITFFGVILTLKYVPDYSGIKSKIDFVSLVLFIGALVLVTLGAMEGQRLGWLSFQILGFFLGGICLAVLFYFYYRIHQTKKPFFDFSLFKKVNFLVGNIHVFIVQFVLMNAVFWAIFFQDGMRYSPSIAGIWTFISTLPVLIIAPLAGYLSDKYGIKLPTTIGFIGLILTFVSLFFFSITNLFFLMIIGLILFGCSISQILTPIGPFIIGAAPPDKRGLASGIFNTMRFTGATMGMAVLGSIYTGVQENQMKQYISNHYHSITTAQRQELKLIYSGVKNTSSEGLDVQSIIRDASKAAYLALKTISLFSLILVIIGFGLVFLEKSKKIKLKELQ